MTAKPLLPQQPVTAKGDAPSRELIEVIQRIVKDTLALNAVETANATNAPGSAPRFFPRAWASFAGATGVVAASGNVASVTRTGSGQYTVTFTTAAPNANYVMAALTNSTTGFIRFTSRATGSCVIETRDSGGTLVDPVTVAVSFLW